MMMGYVRLFCNDGVSLEKLVRLCVTVAKRSVAFLLRGLVCGGPCIPGRLFSPTDLLFCDGELGFVGCFFFDF